MLDRAAARARLADAIAADYTTLARELIPACPAPPGHRWDVSRRQELHWWGGDVVESTRYGASIFIRRDDVDPWQRTPEGADTSLLPVPGLFTDVAQLAGHAATRSEDLVLQLRIMLDAIGDDGRPRIDPKALVRLCATGCAMLKDIEAFGLPPEKKSRGESGPAVAIGSPGAG